MIKLTKQTFDDMIKSGGAAVIGFVANWCAPSMLQVACLEKLATEYDGKMLIGTIDVDEYDAIAQEYGVKTLPAIVLFGKGAPIESFQGYQPEEFLRYCIEQMLLLQQESSQQAQK